MLKISPYNAEEDSISITWNVHDVLLVRPDLQLEQARKVLQSLRVGALRGNVESIIKNCADSIFDEQPTPIYKFNVGDVEDPHLAVSLHLDEWLKNTNYKDISYTLINAPTSFGWEVRVYDAS